jgi:hypothetical protein
MMMMMMIKKSNGSTLYVWLKCVQVCVLFVTPGPESFEMMEVLFFIIIYLFCRRMLQLRTKKMVMYIYFNNPTFIENEATTVRHTPDQSISVCNAGMEK